MSEGSYFVDHKRGEIIELRTHLRNPKLDKDPVQKRDVIKKIIAYMTLGIDVSSLFSDMVMATNTRDLVQKKMVYLYLCTYAEKKPDVALLAVNTLLRDCRDDDPMIRGLALRSLCSLRVPNLVEYIVSPIRTGLTDGSAYVRKTAVMGVAKLYSVSRQLVKDSDLIDILYNMLKDSDPMVIINSIHALNECLVDEGGIVLNRKIVHHLLNKLSVFNEWGQIAVLSVVSKYVPSGNNKSQEIMDIMNLLTDSLQQSNSALVLATIKIFLNLTIKIPNVHKEVYKRIKAPLLTLISNPNLSLAYPVISHVYLLVKKNNKVFQDSYKNFYCRYNDLKCIKELKIKILSLLTNNNNNEDILNELSEYITDVNIDISRLAIQSIGKTAIKVNNSLDIALDHLISFLDMPQSHIVSETCVCIKNILRKYPNKYEMVLNKLKLVMKNVDEENGKCSVLWLLGEYGDCFKEAPYILEQFIDTYDEEESSNVKLEMLSATMKLFFKTPAEVQKMLGRLLYNAVNDDTKIHVRDRATQYYRLLKVNVEKAEKIVNCPKIIVDVFEDPSEKRLIKRIFGEFNTLSVIYNQSSEQFVSMKDSDEEDETDDEDEERKEKEKSKEESSQTNENKTTNDTTKQNGKDNNNTKDNDTKNDVEDVMDNILDMDFGSNNNNNNTKNDNFPKPLLDLTTNPICSPQLFQQCWMQLQNDTNNINLKLKVQSKNSNNVIDNLLKQSNFKTIASGTVNNLFKAYYFCQEKNNNILYFVELLINLSSLDMSANIRGQSQRTQLVADLFKTKIASTLA